MVWAVGRLACTNGPVHHYSSKDSAILRRLGTRIRSLRKAAALSQEQLAHSCELDRTYIGSVERGERNVSVLNLTKIAAGLSVTAKDLLE